MMTPEALARYFDHSMLRAYAQKKDFERLCAECAAYGFAMAAINSAPVRLCKDLLRGTPVHVGAAVGFPLGQTTPAIKLEEARQAIADGADEIDYVINIGRLKDREYAFIADEMNEIVSLCRGKGVISKAIFENCYLTDNEKAELCRIAREVKPDFIKTSTGFGTGGATLQDVDLMVRLTGGEVRVKAAGGVRTLDAALTLIDHGVSRIGTSAGAAIMEEMKNRLGL